MFGPRFQSIAGASALSLLPARMISAHGARLRYEAMAGIFIHA